MAQKDARTGIKKEKGRLYFVADVGGKLVVSSCRASKDGGAKREEARTNVTRDKRRLYFIDKDGDIASSARRNG